LHYDGCWIDDGWEIKLLLIVMVGNKIIWPYCKYKQYVFSFNIDLRIKLNHPQKIWVLSCLISKSKNYICEQENIHYHLMSPTWNNQEFKVIICSITYYFAFLTQPIVYWNYNTPKKINNWEFIPSLQTS
jgi:hypothetical protein